MLGIKQVQDVIKEYRELSMNELKGLWSELIDTIPQEEDADSNFELLMMLSLVERIVHEKLRDFKNPGQI